jgi:hypothetical protein
MKKMKKSFEWKTVHADGFQGAEGGCGARAEPLEKLREENRRARATLEFWTGVSNSRVSRDSVALAGHATLDSFVFILHFSGELSV